MPANTSHPPARAQLQAAGVTRARQAARAAAAVIALALTAAAGPGVTQPPARPGQTVAAHCSELCGTGQPGLPRLPGAV
jgi:hypothetical protein